MHTKIVASIVAVIAAGLVGTAPVATATEDDRGGAITGDVGVATPVARPDALAGGAVTLGEVSAGTATCFFPAPYGFTIDVEDPARSSYTAPFSGVITSYSTVTNATAGSVRLLVLKAGADATHKVLSAKSDLHVVVPSSLNTVPLRVPVKAGERIALGLTATAMSCAGLTSAADTSRVAESFNADASTDFAYSPTMFNTTRPNLSAVLEPDVDGDQYGDVSQDLCPQSKLTQAACPPPDTTVTKQPKKRSSKRKATIKFSSTIAGSTFTCVVDGKAAKVCGSPYKKRFKYGKHVVLITATSPFGIVDPTPAQVKFKVKRPT